MKLNQVLLILWGSLTWVEGNRGERFEAACEAGGSVEAVAALMTGEKDFGELRAWLVSEVEKCREEGPWMVLAEFDSQTLRYWQADRVLTQALDRLGDSPEIQLARAKVRMRQSDYQGCLVDLVALQGKGWATGESELFRVMALSRTERVKEAEELALRLAEVPGNPGKVEFLFKRMEEVGLDQEARAFLRRGVARFASDWRLRYLYALVLEDEEDSGCVEVYESLLEARGDDSPNLEVPDPLHQWNRRKIYGLYGYDPEAFRLKTWAGNFFGETPPRAGLVLRSLVVDQFPDLPESAVEVRGLSFRKLVEFGESPSASGIEHGELFRALCLGDGSFEERALKILEREGDPIKVVVALLKWGDPQWKKGKAGREWTKKALKQLAENDPVFAVEMACLLGDKVVSSPWLMEFVAGQLDCGRPEIFGEVARLVFGKAAAFGTPVVDHPEGGPVRERLVEIALTRKDLGDGEWLRNLLAFLLREERVAEAIRLINRSHQIELTPSQWTKQHRLQNEERYLPSLLHGYPHLREPKRVSLKKILPPRFLHRISPFLAGWGWTSGLEDSGWSQGGLKRASWLERLQEFYPDQLQVENSLEILKPHCHEIEGMIDRAMLESILFVDDFGATMKALRESGGACEQVVLSGLLEREGCLREAYEVLVSIKREGLSALEQGALDERILALAVGRLEGASDDWDREGARKAWMRLVADDPGNFDTNLREAADVLGLEDLVPPPIKREEVVPIREKVDQLIETGEKEKAVAALAQALWDSPTGRFRGELDSILSLVEDKGLVSKVLARMKTEAGGSWTLMRLAKLARELGEKDLEGDCHARILTRHPRHFEARLGELVLQGSQADFETVIAKLSLRDIGKGVRRWMTKESVSHQSDLREEVAILRLLHHLLTTARTGSDLRFAAHFLERKEVRQNAYYISGNGIREVGGTNGLKEERQRLGRAMAFLILEDPELAEAGFRMLYAKRVSWQVSESELREAAKTAFRRGLEAGVVPRYGLLRERPNFFLRIGQEIAAEEFLRSKGLFGKLLDDDTMGRVRDKCPGLASSLDLARRVLKSDAEEAVQIVQAWEAALPAERMARNRAISTMLDDLLVDIAESGPGIDEVERIWLETLAEDPSAWSSGTRLFERWYRWRAKGGEESAGDFIEQVLAALVGPRESWPLLAEATGDRLNWRPRRVSNGVRVAGQLLPIFMEEDSGVVTLLRIFFKEDLVDVMGYDQLLRSFRVVGPEEARDEGMLQYYRLRIRELAWVMASVSKEKLARNALFLGNFFRNGHLSRLVREEERRKEFLACDWYRDLETWVDFLLAPDKKSRLAALQPLLESEVLLREMFALNRKSLVDLLRRHLGNQFAEVEEKLRGFE